MSKIAVTESVFTSDRAMIAYSHTDPIEGDLWVIRCRTCGGHGYDIEVVGFSVCSGCEGLGESAPISEREVTSYLRDGTDFPF